MYSTNYLVILDKFILKNHSPRLGDDRCLCVEGYGMNFLLVKDFHFQDRLA